MKHKVKTIFFLYCLIMISNYAKKKKKIENANIFQNNECRTIQVVAGT